MENLSELILWMIVDTLLVIGFWPVVRGGKGGSNG